MDVYVLARNYTVEYEPCFEIVDVFFSEESAEKRRLNLEDPMEGWIECFEVEE